MADSLFINGERMDLSSDDQAGITLAVNDLGDMSTRQGSFSPTIKLPLTDNNRRVMDHISSLVAGSRIPYSSVGVDYYSGGVQLIGDGIGVVQEVGNAITINLLSGNSTFFQAIEGKKLTDLDLSAYDLQWTHDNVVACYGNNVSPVTALISDGNLSEDARLVDTKLMYFNMYIADIIEAIFADAGFTAHGDIFSDPNYTNKIFPFTLKEPRQGIPVITASDSKIYGAADAYGVNQNGSIPIILIDETTPAYDVNNNYDTNTGEYTAPYGGVLSIQGRLVIGDIWLGSSNALTVKVKVNINGTMVQNITAYTQATINFNDVNYYDLDTEVNVDAGDVVTLSLLWVQVPTLEHRVGILDGANTAGGRTNIRFVLTEKLLWGGEWFQNRNLPDMTQRDFLKMFVQLFGQSFQVDDFAREINFFTVDDVVANRGTQNSRDWSDYFEHGSETIKFRSTYNQVNDCKFREDDEVPQFTGDSSFTVSDVNLKQRGDVITVPVSASKNVRKLRGIDMCEILRIDEDGNELNPQPRLVSVDSRPLPQPNLNDYIRFQEIGTSNINDFFSAFTTVFDYDMTSVLDGYYQAWISILNDYKSVSGVFLLPAHEVANMDFKRPVYVSKLSSWFYVNKIENYKNGKKCKVELIQV